MGKGAWHGTVQTERLMFPFSFFISQEALMVKNPLPNAGDYETQGLIPGWGRSSGGGNGNPLQHSCLENPTDRGAWHATVHRSQRVRHY